MTHEELETAINELEERVERLRVLYDQYFMGIERIEPMNQRKDVDKRIWVLRREQIRNTGQRFRFNTVASRYITFSQYWGRILREIENGTYKRDLLKAAKKFGTEPLTAAAKRRLGKKKAEEVEAAAAAARREEAAQAAAADDFDDLSQTRPGVGAPSLGSVAPPTPMPTTRPKSAHVHLELDDDDELFAGLDVTGTKAGLGEAPAFPSAPAFPRPGSGQVQLPRPPSGQAVVPRTPSAAGTLPRPPSGEAQVPRAPSQATALPRPPSGVGPVPRTPSQADARPASGETAVPRTPSGAQPVPPVRPMLRSGLAASSPFGGGGGVPRAPSQEFSVHEKPTRPAGEAAPPAKPPAPKPAAPAPAARPAAPAAREDGGSLSDQRVKELYSKYVDAKKQCNESTSTITTDSLAKSLRDSATKLREKHKGKNVDFDVVIKDGKAVLKPVLKG